MFLCLSILTYNANAIIQTALLVPQFYLYFSSFIHAFYLIYKFLQIFPSYHSVLTPPQSGAPSPHPAPQFEKNPMVQDLSKIDALLLFSLLLSLDQHIAGVPTGAGTLQLSSGARYAFYYVHLFQSIYHSFIVFCLQLILVSQDRITTQSYIYLLMTFLLTFASKVMTKVSAIQNNNRNFSFVVISSKTKHFGIFLRS